MKQRATFLLTAALIAAPGANAEFIALSGAEAEAYVVPNGYTLTSEAQESGLTRLRYQHMVGDAETIGGQLTVIARDGQTIAVIGNAYDKIVPRNRVVLDKLSAIMATGGRGTGTWDVTLMIRPEDGRLVYRAVNNRFNSRPTFQIDATSGLVLERFDAIAHGSGVGVKGDTKSWADLTTGSSFTSYIMLVSHSSIAGF